MTVKCCGPGVWFNGGSDIRIRISLRSIEECRLMDDDCQSSPTTQQSSIINPLQQALV